MQPTQEQVHRSAALDAISIGYRNQMFIGDRVFQDVPVQKQADYFYYYQKGAFFRNDAGLRGPGANAPRGGYIVADTEYKCQERAFAHPLSIEVINNADLVLDPWTTGVNFATLKILLAKEVVISALCCTAANWTSTNDAEAGWVATADGSGNTFIADVEAAKEAIRQLIGMYPNVMVMDAKTFMNCKREFTVLERIKYTGTSGAPAAVTQQTLAQLFELDEVIVGGALYSDAEEILAGTDFNAVDLWETNATKGSCFLFYRPPTAGREMPAAGYVFQWKGGANSPDLVLPGDAFRSVRYWWESSPKQWVIEAAENFDAQVTCADAGYLFTDTIVT